MDGKGDNHRGFGFLTMVCCEDGGYSGGFLVLNGAGRPLEFHCTASVKPSRAQEILYGPTLAPYLFGEQIGKTLTAKSKSELSLIFTDVEACHALRDQFTTPLLLVDDPADGSTSTDERRRDPMGAHLAEADEPTATAAGNSEIPQLTEANAASSLASNSSTRRFRHDQAHEMSASQAHWQGFKLETNSFAYCQAYAEDRSFAERCLASNLQSLDFAEPFARIREAVKETLNHGRL